MYLISDYGREIKEPEDQRKSYWLQILPLNKVFVYGLS